MRVQPDRARAAPVLVQQPDRRLPGVRRTRRPALLRSGPNRAAPGTVAGWRSNPGLGSAQPVLLPDDQVAVGALRLRSGTAVSIVAEEDPEHPAERQRQRGNPVSLRQRPRQQGAVAPCLRGRDPEHEAALPGNGIERGPRGAR